MDHAGELYYQRKTELLITFRCIHSTSQPDAGYSAAVCGIDTCNSVAGWPLQVKSRFYVKYGRLALYYLSYARYSGNMPEVSLMGRKLSV